MGLGTLVVAAVLHHDFHELPEKAYQAFGIPNAPFPEGFKDTALAIWWVVLGGFALCALITWVERDADREPFDPASYAKVLRALREAYDGILALVYFATIAGASVAGLLVVVGTRTRAHWLPQMSSTIRDQVLNAWWRISFIPLGLVFGFLFACDVWLWAFGKSKPVSVGLADARVRALRGAAREALSRRATSRRCPSYEWWVALVLIAPLMLLAIPAVAFEALHETGHSALFSVLLAVPAGVAFFLAMGLVGRPASSSSAGAGAGRRGGRLRPLLLLLPGARQPALAERGVRELPTALPGRSAGDARGRRTYGGLLRGGPAADAHGSERRVQVARGRARRSVAAWRSRPRSSRSSIGSGASTRTRGRTCRSSTPDRARSCSRPPP